MMLQGAVVCCPEVIDLRFQSFHVFSEREWRDQVSSVSAGQTFGELALVQKYEALQIYKFSAESVCSFLQFTVLYPF